MIFSVQLYLFSYPLAERCVLVAQLAVTFAFPQHMFFLRNKNKQALNLYSYVEGW